MNSNKKNAYIYIRCNTCEDGLKPFSGKPIKLIDGEPMIWHVWQRSLLSKVLDQVVVATCDREIKEAAEAFGGSSRHDIE